MAARQSRADRRRAPRSRRWRAASPTTAASTSCRRSPASTRRTGTTARAASIAGLTRYANKGHIARAALEATAFQTRDVLEAMSKDTGIAVKELRIDGGMVVNELLMQFQADILDVPVVRPKVIETTALGAAYAAGLATGFWAGPDELVRNWGVDKRWTPAMPAQERERLYGAWSKAVARSLDWKRRQTASSPRFADYGVHTLGGRQGASTSSSPCSRSEWRGKPSKAKPERTWGWNTTSPRRFLDDRARLSMAAAGPTAALASSPFHLAQPPPTPTPPRHSASPSGGREEREPTCVNLAALWGRADSADGRAGAITVQPARALPSPGRLSFLDLSLWRPLRTLIMTDPNFRAISAILTHDDPHFHHDGAVFPGVSSGEPTAARPPSPRSRRAPPSRRGARPARPPSPGNARRRSRGRRGRAPAGSRRIRRRRARTR